MSADTVNSYLVLTEAQQKALQKLSAQINDSPGMIGTHHYHFRRYKHTIVGQELVTWLVDHGHAPTRADGVLIGQQLLDADLIHHGFDDHTFKDASFLLCQR